MGIDKTHLDLVLGIDGGGSKTVAWLGRRSSKGAEDAIVGRGAAGGSNLQTQGIELSLANLAAAIEAAFADAGLARATVAAAVAALAGSDRDENRRVFQDWAGKWNVAERFRITHDAEPVLAAGTPEGWGVALIAGTGSFAFARSPDGKTARAGGWGYLFGDEGSGYWIAVEGLRAAARAADGRGSSTELLSLLKDQFHVAASLDLVRAIYPIADDRAAIAALAGVVFHAADGGDATATMILERAAEKLAQTAVAAAHGAGIAQAAFPLAIAGGALLHRVYFLSHVCARIRDRGASPAPVAHVANPVAGAVILARRELT